MGYKENLMGLGMPGELASAIEAHDASTGALTPAADNTYDIGTSALEYKNLFLEGKASITGATGGFLWGATSVDADVRAFAGDPPVYVQSNPASTGFPVICSFGNNSSGQQLVFVKTRATGANADTIVQDGDFLGTIHAFGADGATYRSAARIDFRVAGTPGVGDMPGSIGFLTSADGAASPSIRFVIGPTGNLTQDATNGGNIVLSKASTSVAQPVNVGVTAAGTTTADATALTGIYNTVTTVAASTGVRLPDVAVGSTVYVQNLGANNLEVYPFTGGAINGAATNAGITLAAATDDVGTFHRVATNTWIGTVAAGPAT